MAEFSDFCANAKRGGQVVALRRADKPALHTTADDDLSSLI